MYKVKTTRVEKDFLGEREIPVHALWHTNLKSF